MSRDVSAGANTCIGDHMLEGVGGLVQLNSTSNLSLNNELSLRVGKAATTMAGSAKKVQTNLPPSMCTKMEVKRAGVLGALRSEMVLWK